MKCLRCGQWTERYTVAQRYCATCEREVAALIAADARRRTRFPFAKELAS